MLAYVQDVTFSTIFHRTKIIYFEEAFQYVDSNLHSWIIIEWVFEAKKTDN